MHQVIFFCLSRPESLLKKFVLQAVLLHVSCKASRGCPAAGLLHGLRGIHGLRQRGRELRKRGHRKGKLGIRIQSGSLDSDSESESGSVSIFGVKAVIHSLPEYC
jgi:hypothetical protein